MSIDDVATISATTAMPNGAPGPADVDAAGALPVLDRNDPVSPSPDDRFARLPIEALGEVELKVEVVLGRARLRLQELLDVRPGQAIELDRSRNSPVDVLVNGTLFARGDIVVIDDTNLGVRVSEIVGQDPVKEGRN